MTSVLALVFLLTGSGFILIAAIGVLRFLDPYTRMQTLAKAGTIGIGCVLLAVAIYFADLGVLARILPVIAFFVLSAPIAAHMIARAAYVCGVLVWRKTHIDELAEHRRG